MSLFVHHTCWKIKYKEMEKKGNKSGSKRKNTDYKPGAAVSVNQLQSYQTLSVAQLSGKLTNARIWDA